MKTYRTAQVAQIIGIHPNTVRLYEELGLISRPERRANGYRVFTDLHIAQFCLARTALRVEVLQNGQMPLRSSRRRPPGSLTGRCFSPAVMRKP